MKAAFQWFAKRRRELNGLNARQDGTMGELWRANVILYKTVRAFKQPSEDGLVCVMLDIVGVHKTKVVGTKIGLKLLQDLSRLLY